MLQKTTVEGTTFELLKELMRDEKLKGFYLVGGTALALQIGHRKSVDIDLFTQESFNSSELNEYLFGKYGFNSNIVAEETTKGTINGVKIDCIAYKYKNIFQPLEIEGVRMLDIRDISAMKLSAIADNGTRLKDFVDIAFLSTKISLKEMIDCYEKKYPMSIPSRALRGLTFFEDIIKDEPIILLEGKYEWKEVEKRIFDMIKHKDKIYSNLPIKNIEIKNKFVPKPKKKKGLGL